MSFALSAVFSALVSVRILKGSWMRYPQYLALSIIGGLIALLLLHQGWPQFDDDMILPTIAAFVGACASVFAFDQTMGAE